MLSLQTNKFHSMFSPFDIYVTVQCPSCGKHSPDGSSEAVKAFSRTLVFCRYVHDSSSTTDFVEVNYNLVIDNSHGTFLVCCHVKWCYELNAWCGAFRS